MRVVLTILCVKLLCIVYGLNYLDKTTVSIFCLST